MRLTALASAIIGALLTGAAPMPAAAYEQGEVRLNDGTQTREVELSDSDIIDNRPGAEITRSWNIATTYRGYVHCEQASIPPIKSFYFKTTSSLPASGLNPGFFRINEFIDVKVEILVAGNDNNYHTIPFNDINNQDRNYQCQSPGQNISNPFASASQGKVTFKLRKSITNGALVDDLETFDMFGRMDGDNTRYGTEPMFKVKIKTAIIGVPEKCVFNDGNPVNIDFGDIGLEGLDGSRHKQNFSINFVCTGGDFDNGSKNIKLTVQGVPSDFSSEVFRTDKTGLGIKLTAASGTISPNVSYAVNSTNNSGSWQLQAAPLASSGARLTAGEFNAAATVIASFD